MPGIIRVKALKPDGKPYRWWDAALERQDGTLIVMVAAAGREVCEPGGSWKARGACRFHYWSDRWYNVVELFSEDGTPGDLHIHVASPALLEDGVLSYRDLELDVVKRRGEPAVIVDVDEFEQAVRRYGFTPEFAAHCRRTAEEARRVAEAWVWSTMEPAAPHRDDDRREHDRP